MTNEDRLQQACFNTFWNKYPKLRKLLFSVPNGGYRRGSEAMVLKATGLVAGVSDLILIYNNTPYCFELKTEIGTQSKSQKEWEEVVTKTGGAYYKIIRSVEEFVYELEQIIDDKYKFKRQ